MFLLPHLLTSLQILFLRLQMWRVSHTMGEISTAFDYMFLSEWLGNWSYSGPDEGSHWPFFTIVTRLDFFPILFG